jgi:O-antigen/teichoic acid export membrane protein
MSAITEYQSEGARNFYTKVFDAYQSMMVIASAGILMFVKPIMSLLTGGTDFYEGYVYVPMLLIGVVFCCFCQFLSSIYSATKNTKNSLWTSLIAALVNVLLNIVFIPRIGVQGACLSMVCGYAACFIVRIIDTRRYIKFHFNVVKFLVNISLLAMMGFTIILDYSHLVVWLVSGFALVVLYNYSSILETLKQIIGKKKKA